MERPILIISALAMLGAGANSARAQSEPVWTGFAPTDQVADVLSVWTENEVPEAAPLSLVPPKTCDVAVAGPSINQTCRRQMKDFKAGMQARNDRRADAPAFDNGDEGHDGLTLDGLKLKAYHRF